MSGRAADPRLEDYRRDNGQFGTRPHAEAEVDLVTSEEELESASREVLDSLDSGLSGDFFLDDQYEGEQSLLSYEQMDPCFRVSVSDGRPVVVSDGVPTPGIEQIQMRFGAEGRVLSDAKVQPHAVGAGAASAMIRDEVIAARAYALTQAEDMDEYDEVACKLSEAMGDPVAGHQWVEDMEEDRFRYFCRDPKAQRLYAVSDGQSIYLDGEEADYNSLHTIAYRTEGENGPMVHVRSWTNSDRGRLQEAHDPHSAAIGYSQMSDEQAVAKAESIRAGHIASGVLRHSDEASRRSRNPGTGSYHPVTEGKTLRLVRD